MENRRNLLVTLADKKYILQAKQLFSSVYWNAGWDGDYMLLSHEIPAEELKWFTDKKILIKECVPLHNKPFGDDNNSPVILDKFYLFSEEFRQWEHIIFIDSDAMVTASLDYLIKTKSFSCLRVNKKHFRHSFSLRDCEQISMLKKEYNLIRPSFNSGVLAFDTAIIKDDTFSKLLSLFNKYKEIINADESILNLFFYEQWINIPIVYNARINNIVLKKIKGIYHVPKKMKGIILHFEKPYRKYLKDDKPWNKGNIFYNEWETNLKRAEFIDLNKIQKPKKWNILKIRYYTLLLNTIITLDNLEHSFFRYNIESFFRYRLKYFAIHVFNYTISTPDRLLGKIGDLIKKFNPDLYHKLRKIKGEK